MDRVSILCVLLGLLIVAVRGPLLVAPKATLRFYDRLVATDGRVRIIGLVLLPLAAALVALPLGEGWGAGALRVLGWILAAATLWLLAAPGSYRRLARDVLDFFQSSVDEAVVRMVGFVAVAIGVALIFAGIDGV